MSEFKPAESIDRLGPSGAALAEAASLAIRIEMQLLRKLRLDLFPALDAGTEADVWFSAIVESRTPSGIVFRPPAVELLRQRLGEKPAALEAAWNVIEALHRNISPAIFAEERLAYLALAGKQDQMRDLLRSLVATLVSPRGLAIAGWAARAIDRLPKEARMLEEAQMLAFGSGVRLREGSGWEFGVSSERSAEWAGWLSPDDLDTVPFGIVLLEDAVEFGPTGRPGSHRMELPRTTPVVVQVGWHDGASERTERVALNANALTIVEFGPGVTQVDIRTILGDSYWLTVPAPRERSSAQKKISRVRPARVQLTYDVETGNAIERKELPFVIGIMADLTGHPLNPLPELKDRRFAYIDPDNFDAVMKNMGPRLALKTENHLGDPQTMLGADLKFDSVEDFEPAAVARQIAPTNALLERRVRLAEVLSLVGSNSRLKIEMETALADPGRRAASGRSAGEAPAFRAAVLAAQPIKNPKRAEDLAAEFLREVSSRSEDELTLGPDPLISSNETSAGGDWPGPEAMSSFTVSLDAETFLNTRIAAIDSSLSRQMSAVLHHPAFQALESAWRSLKYLVMQVESSASLRIRVWNISKKELAQDLIETSNPESGVALRKIAQEEFSVFGGSPFGLIVGAYEFGRSPEDIAILERLAAIGAAGHTPFVAAASAGMLQLESFKQLDDPRDIRKLFASSDAADWNTLRELEDARYVGLTLPRVLLRAPYGNEAAPVEEFRFEEDLGGSDPSLYLWGSAAFPLAARVADAFAKYGWLASIRGIEGGGLVEGMRSYPSRSDKRQENSGRPAEIAITDRREMELADAGLIPLCLARGTDAPVFFSVNSIRKPPQYKSPDGDLNARLSIQLPYVLVCSRFAHYIVCMMRDKLGSFMHREQIESFLNHWIANYVSADDSASQTSRAERPLREALIEVVEIEGRPGSYRAIVFLRPYFQLDELTVSLRMVVDLPR